MLHSPNLFPLKVLVISLGVFLVGAILFVLVTISTRANSAMTAVPCPNAALNLNGKGSLVSIIPQGSNIQVTIRSREVIQVLTLDRCSGRLLQTFTVAP